MNVPNDLYRTHFVDPALINALADDDINRYAALAADWFQMLRRACCRIEGECWIWNGKNYPQATGGMRMHRLVATVMYGDITGQSVHHKCANKACINPDHLQLVTRAENSAEMLARRDYERFIERCLDRIESYNPNDPILSEAMPGAVRTPAERRGK